MVICLMANEQKYSRKKLSRLLSCLVMFGRNCINGLFPGEIHHGHVIPARIGMQM